MWNTKRRLTELTGAQSNWTNSFILTVIYSVQFANPSLFALVPFLNDNIPTAGIFVNTVPFNTVKSLYRWIKLPLILLIIQNLLKNLQILKQSWEISQSTRRWLRTGTTGFRSLGWQYEVQGIQRNNEANSPFQFLLFCLANHHSTITPYASTVLAR